jgi:ABC-type multidrug transport system fused ATPase/permease subunit
MHLLTPLVCYSYLSNHHHHQDPVLFSGTIRSNLDPFLLYTDTQIWDNLRRSMLAASISSLDDLVLENGMYMYTYTYI